MVFMFRMYLNQKLSTEVQMQGSRWGGCGKAIPIEVGLPREPLSGIVMANIGLPQSYSLSKNWQGNFV